MRYKNSKTPLVEKINVARNAIDRELALCDIVHPTNESYTREDELHSVELENIRLREILDAKNEELSLLRSDIWRTERIEKIRLDYSLGAPLIKLKAKLIDAESRIESVYKDKSAIEQTIGELLCERDAAKKAQLFAETNAENHLLELTRNSQERDTLKWQSKSRIFLSMTDNLRFEKTALYYKLLLGYVYDHCVKHNREMSEGVIFSIQESATAIINNYHGLLVTVLPHVRPTPFKELFLSETETDTEL